MSRVPHGWWHVAALAVLLSGVAVAAPEPWYATDREHYETLGRELIIPDCSSLHCTRLLVPAVLEQLPGPSLPKWKAAAVIGNTWAAAAVASLSLALGYAPYAAVIAFWLTGLGFGGLYTLFDPYSADPLMFALGPVLTLWLVRGQLPRAGIVAAVGIVAKEFAAAPLWICAGALVLAQRWVHAARYATVALAVTALWAVMQVGFIVWRNYSYDGNPSADVMGGGYLLHWVNNLGWRAALNAVFTEYGAVYLLAPFGFVLAPVLLRQLCVAALPAVAAFVYVQQPDRALWNFHYLVMPLAALVLARVPRSVTVALLITFAIANLRLAAQLPFLPAARYALGASLAIALGAVVLALVHARPRLPGTVQWPSPVAFSPGLRALLICGVLMMGGTALLAADMSLHRTIEQDGDLNRQGYRGTVLPAKVPGEVRVALVGGATAFSPDLRWDQSMGFVLQRFVGQRWRWERYVPVKIADLSQPGETTADLTHTLARYRHLGADIVCVLTGHNDLPGVEIADGGRETSLVFRTTGYLPAFPAWLEGTRLAGTSPQTAVDAAWIRSARAAGSAEMIAGECSSEWAAYCRELRDLTDQAVAAGKRVLIVAEPYVSRHHFDQQRHAAAMIAHRYPDADRVRYLELGWQVDLLDSTMATTSGQLTPRGIEHFADGLFSGIHAMMTKS